MVYVADSGHFQPVRGRIFHIESEFGITISGFRRPGTKIEEKRPGQLIFQPVFRLFVFFKPVQQVVDPSKGPQILPPEDPPEKNGNCK